MYDVIEINNKSYSLLWSWYLLNLRVREEADLILKFQPALCFDGMSIGIKRFFDGISGRHPGTFHVAEYGSKENISKNAFKICLMKMLPHNRGHNKVLCWGKEKINSLDFDPRSLLPNYDTIDWAVKNYQEYHQIRSEYESYIGWRTLSFKGETFNIDSNCLIYKI